MKISFITLFPNFINSYINESIIKRAIEKNKVEIKILNLRDFSKMQNKQIDDYQFGGGKGMVMMVEPLVEAIRSIKTKNSLVILTSPQGKVLNQNISKELSISNKDLIIICGHYEGYDERIVDYVDMELSIGDYVLTGGELPALVLLDSITRLIKGVIMEESHENDSFSDGLLDYPVYTKPREFEGKLVPEVLLSGNHKKIKEFRQIEKIKNTFYKRPDILDKIDLSENDQKILKNLKNKKGDS